MHFDVAWLFCLCYSFYMKQIAEITLPNNLDISLMYDNGKLAYTFDYDGKQYGNATKLPSKKITDIAATCLILFTNALETRKELEKPL